MALLGGVGISMIGSYIKPLLKNKYLWAAIGVAIAVGGLMWTFSSMTNRIEDLSADVQEAQQRADQLSVNNKTLQNTVGEIENRLQSLRQAQQRINETREQLSDQLESVRGQLDNIDVSQDPEKAAEQLTNVYAEQLECIEYVTGKQDANCPSLQKQKFND